MKHILIEHKKGKRPSMAITVRRVEPSVWKSLGFHKHHYLTEQLNPSCKCLLFEWNNQPIGFVGLLNTPRKGMPYGMSISRLVVNPDFQGLGFAHKILDFCGGIVTSLKDKEHDYVLYIKSAHEKIGASLNNNPKWEGTCFDGKTRNPKAFDTQRYANRLVRKSYCKRYIGDAIYGYEDLLLPIQDMRKNKLCKITPITVAEQEQPQEILHEGRQLLLF